MIKSGKPTVNGAKKSPKDACDSWDKAAKQTETVKEALSASLALSLSLSDRKWERLVWGEDEGVWRFITVSSCWLSCLRKQLSPFRSGRQPINQSICRLDEASTGSSVVISLGGCVCVCLYRCCQPTVYPVYVNPPIFYCVLLLKWCHGNKMLTSLPS